MTTPKPPSAAPTSTYRLQFNEDFTFADAIAQLDHLAHLGVSHLFCSPILQAAPGSTHGYDVVDHTRISQECGGEEDFRRLCAKAHDAGLGIVVDVVPNHMAVPTPLWHNYALWSVLRDGPSSPYAAWFDVDVSRSLSILMAILGDRIGTELTAGTIHVETRDITDHDGTTHAEHVVVYHDHVFPVRPGTESLPLAELLDQQWYRLAYWKVATEELNYRRFFNVDTLAAIRVENDDVFTASHAKLLQLYHDGLIDGFRIDHPDGLANPHKYLADLRQATGGAWVVVEKILEPSETLSGELPCAGTTGYDSLLRIDGLFIDPTGLVPLGALYERICADDDSRLSFPAQLDQAKREVLDDMLVTELNRLANGAMDICASDIMLRDHTRRQLTRAITELLVAMNRYRAYLEPGRVPGPGEVKVIEAAANLARLELPEEEHDTLELVVDMVCGRLGPSTDPVVQASRDEFMVRFAQTCGPVMAKAKEDTAFYRYTRFTAVNEVGCDPEVAGISVDDFHDFASSLGENYPTTMTTLSTHDTKRSTDVRARLASLTEFPHEWEHTVAALETATADQRSELLDGATINLLWQTLAGTWRLPGTAAGARPISEDRLVAYLTKAVREAKSHTTWTDPDNDYESALMDLARFCLTDDSVATALDSFTETASTAVRAAILGRVLVQLTMPGVPDTYQGCEVVDLSLVDPDNRRPVDHNRCSQLLRAVEKGLDAVSPEDRLDAEKLLVVHRALDVRHRHADAFRGDHASYRPVATTTGHAVAFARGIDDEPPIAITIATRLAGALEGRGGWLNHQVVLPEETFTDVITGQTRRGGTVKLADLLDVMPVALLVRQEKR
ncbi:malto-oligosyltrehalose synthase [Cutibacterium sp. WCA-380-WT-3A]|uniref:Malto-oligosyltrehalose synthase n=1 Tax=Cutibacterium porci TaxID=2605781 RepID=A0A7K0J4K2_9ACTN|nr:malto-oligosyltrehalose synthase [Cutibacterium porci]MSS44864.1 malto-oligosyltrehalose synthase [Cutibacterium porci]